jgi:hypothetical protein
MCGGSPPAFLDLPAPPLPLASQRSPLGRPLSSSQRPPCLPLQPLTPLQALSKHADRLPQGTGLRRRDLGASAASVVRGEVTLPRLTPVADPSPLSRRQRINRRVRLAKRSGPLTPSSDFTHPNDPSSTAHAPQTIRAPLAAFVAAVGLGLWLFTTSRTLADQREHTRETDTRPTERIVESSREARRRAFSGRLW